MQSNFKSTRLTFKVAVLFTSAAITTLIFSRQHSLAEFYASKPDAALVAARSLPVAVKVAFASPAHRGLET